MSANIIEKIRAARQSVVEAGGFKFIVRRPTDAEAMSMTSVPLRDVVVGFVVGWDGVKELDIIPGGNPTPVQFSRELWEEWSADRPEFWQPIASAVMDAYSRHRAVMEDAEKN